jgi:hypothetical protein
MAFVCKFVIKQLIFLKMRKQSRSIIYPKNKSVQVYLDKLLYPSLQKAMDEVYAY